jgi:glutamate decarboxylase
MHLGFTGYRQVMENSLANARLLSRSLEATGWYRCISDIHRQNGEFEYNREKALKKPYEEGENSSAYNPGLPVVAFALSNEFKQKYPHVKQAALSNLLRAKQYIIPSTLRPFLP